MICLKSLVGFEYSSDLQSDLNKLKDIGRSLKAASGKATIEISNLVSLIALAALPSSFAPLRAVIENSASEDPQVLSFSNLETRILAEEASTATTTPSHKALNTQSSSKTKCQHNRIAPCWTCNPELRPSCPSCKASGLKSYHREGSRGCPQLKKGKVALPSPTNGTSSQPMALLAYDNDQSSSSLWILDSGATDHMSHDIQLFNAFTPSDRKVFTASGDPMNCTGTGSIPFSSESHHFELQKVLHCPTIQHNLISVSRLVENGCQVSFTMTACKILNNNGEVLFSGTRQGPLFRVNLIATPATACLAQLHHDFYGPASSALVITLDANTGSRSVALSNTLVASYSAALFSRTSSLSTLWHLQMALSRLSSMADGIPSIPTEGEAACISCLKSKGRRHPFPTRNSRMDRVGDLIHTDITGPLPVKSVSGFTYILTFTDDYSRFVWAFPLKNKSDTFAHFSTLNNQIRNLTGHSICHLRSDNGTEFKNKSFTDYCKTEGIQQQFTVPYSPQQNGVAERLNQTLLGSIRCMLNYSGLAKIFWAEALACAVYLKNVSPSAAIKTPQTPYELKTGRRPNLNHLRIFGEPAFALIPKEKRSKLDDSSTCLTFIGYSLDSKGYRLLDPLSHKVTISRDVTFLSDYKPIPFTATDSTAPVRFPPPMTIETSSTLTDSSDQASPALLQPSDSDTSGSSLPHSIQNVVESMPDPAAIDPCNILASSRRSQALLITPGAMVPSKFHDILSFPQDERSLWKSACDEELLSLKKHTCARPS